MRIIQSLVLSHERSVSGRTIHQRSLQTASLAHKLGDQSVGRIIGQERVSACRLNAKFAISAACQHTGIHQDSSRERERESQCPDTKMQRPCGDVSMHRFAAGRPWYPDSC